MKNLIVFVEIPAINFERAVKFYETAFGVKLAVCDACEEEKMAFFSDFKDKPNLAISYAPNFLPSRDGTLIHLSTEDVEATLYLINANGGETIQPKTKIEADDMGYFATFADSEGNRVGLYSE